MHAASVHPEPGSNSRNHCIKTTKVSLGQSNLFCFRVLLLASFTFCLSSILILRISEIRFKLLIALYFSLVVQFSRIISPPLLRQLEYYTTFLRLCQYLLQKFFHLFSGFSRLFVITALLADSLTIITLCTRFVKRFCEKNRKFLIFVKFRKTES